LTVNPESGNKHRCVSSSSSSEDENKRLQKKAKEKQKAVEKIQNDICQSNIQFLQNAINDHKKKWHKF
jgi:predicted alpha/beta superfamily hydrolase